MTSLPSPPADALIGRALEMEALEVALERAVSGRSAVVTVRGEAGIGKSRLLEEFAASAVERGVLPLTGRCYETAAAPALWPWGQIFEALCRAAQGLEAAAELQPFIALMAEGLPGIWHPSGWRPAAHLEPERARFRLFDSAARFLTAASGTRPLLAILEDVHAADPATLHLVEFVARECAGARLLLLASYRDLEVGADLAAVLARLAGLSRHREIVLTRLSEAETTRLAHVAAGAEAEPRLLRTVVERSEGNPLFALELVRSLVERGQVEGSRAAGDLSPSLLAVIRTRLDRLSPSCLKTLTLAAAIGREFEVRELEQVTGGERREILERLDEARRQRAVLASPGAVGRYRFTHGLVREALYQRLGDAERAELHRRIGEALETVHAGEIESHLPEIADHLTRGALAGGAPKALAYARRAGRAALRRHAYEEAARQFERALAVGELAGVDEGERCNVLLELADAEDCAGSRAAAHERFAAVVGRARRLRAEADPRGGDLLARAALGVARMRGEVGIFDADLVRLLDEALVTCPPDGPVRARLLARLAVALFWSDAAERRLALSAEALEMARRLGDRETLAYALSTHHYVLLGADCLSQQIAIADEALRTGRELRDTELEMAGLFWRLHDRLHLGEVEAARRDLQEYTRRAEESRQPYFRYNAILRAALFAILEGRLVEGEQLAGRALELGQRGQSRNATHYYGIQMFVLSLLRGREESMLGAVQAFAERLPGIPAWRAALACLHANLGHTAEAEREIEPSLSASLGNLPRDVNFLCACALLARASASFGQRPLARLLYEALRPYAERSVVIGALGYLGVVSHYLGLSASVIGRADRADAWFADALRRYEAVGARPFLAWALLDRAEAAIRSRAEVATADGADPSRDALEHALALAREMGMERCAEQAERLLAAAAGAAAPAAAGEPGVGLFRREGDYWTIAFEGIVVRVRHAKGLQYLGELLRSPAREFHVLDLMQQSDGRLRRADAGPVIDGRARTEYRGRLADLRLELEEGERTGDLGQVAQARAEIEQLTDALAGAFGLGGRSRRALAAAERARLNVTRAIRGVIRRIAISHPALARHLDTSVATGRFCRYQPKGGGPSEWRF
jgi:hypothetical protein